MTVRTSRSHPLRIDFAAAPGGGEIGMTFCPGKRQHDAASGAWQRDLAADLDAVVAAGASALLSLIEDHEFAALAVPGLGAAARARGLDWAHLPIADGATPDAGWEAGWQRVGAGLRARLDRGERIVVHCKGGLGRAGSVAARLLVELGVAPEAAIARVRAARPGAIENAAQEAWVRARRPLAAATAPSRAERLAGGLLGLLVGDALGVPYEFKSRRELPPMAQIEMQPPAGFRRTWPRVPPGTWSDDGALALCLLESLLDGGGFRLDDFAGRMLRWMRDGHLAVDAVAFDIGIATSAGLNRLAAGVAAGQSGGRSERDNGNGALMRVLPLALLHRGPDAELVADARQSSLPTHGHLRSQLCCALYVLWARALLDGLAPEAGWAQALAILRGLHAPGSAEREELDGPILGFADADCRGSGYVVDSLHCARRLLAAPDYETAMKQAVALGNDTDTTACIAGGLAGLRWGVAGIPARWREALRGRSLLDPLLARLLAAA